MDKVPQFKRYLHGEYLMQHDARGEQNSYLNGKSPSAPQLYPWGGVI